MKISFTCSNPDCAKQLNVAPDFAGKKGRCPHCGTIQRIPTSTELSDLAQMAKLQAPAPAPAPASPAAKQADPPWAPRTGRIVGDAKRRPMEPLKPFTPKKG